MTSSVRYSNQDLYLPKSFHTEFLDSLVDQTRADAPFRRQVDLWWYAVALAVRGGERVRLPDRERLVKFNDAGILETDPWRLTHLELVVLADEGQEAAANPTRVIRWANECALAGCSMLEEVVRGVLDPQQQLVAYLAGEDTRSGGGEASGA